ncbi:MAG: L-lysine 6-transaminase [Desulfobacterales bacterium]|jgi:L-lysine 6-transaminase
MKTDMDVHGTLGRYILADGMDLVMDLERSHGSWIVDQRDGAEYLDLYTMYASQAIGYNHPRMMEISDELARAATQKPICSDIYTEPMARFMEVFARVAMPAYLPHAFFIEGGALAVENALKAAFDWKTRLNLPLGKDHVHADRIIHFKEAFHGRSGYTLSLTNTYNPDKTRFFPKFDWPRIDNPKLRFPVDAAEEQRVSEAEGRALKQIKLAIHQFGDRIAGLIIEPIQSEGGDNHFRPEFMQALRELCNENRIIFILDEVQTGVGLTGRFWAHEHHGVQPDIISFGKKTQVCGMLAGPIMDEVSDNVFQRSLRIGSTFGGNLVDMVRCKRILEIIESERLVDAAEQQGAYLLAKLRDLQSRFSGTLSNVRGQGLLCAFDLPDPEFRKRFAERCVRAGLLVVGCGPNSIRFRPHLNVSTPEIDHGLKVMADVLTDMA